MIKNLGILMGTFVIVVASIITYQLWDTILIIGLWLAYFIGAILAITMAYFGYLAIIFITNLKNDIDEKNRQDKISNRLDNHAKEIANRHNDIQIITAPAGQNVFVGSTSQSEIEFKPLHLGGIVNGKWEATQNMIDLQSDYNRLYAPKQPNIKNEIVPQLEDGNKSLPELLPELLNSGRVLIGGGSNSGKSNLAKHVIAARSQDSQIIIIDPHAPSKIMGIDVIGSGMDFEKIDDTMTGLVEIMKSRYEDIKQGVCKHHEHPKLFIVIDELTSIIDNCESAPQAIKDLLTQSRKVSISMLLLVHGLDTKTLKVPAGIRSSSTLVWLEGGENKPYKSFILPARGLQSKKSDRVEYQSVGPFNGYPERSNVIEKLPNAIDIKIVNLTRQGFSNNDICKAIYNSKNKKNLDYIKAVQQGVITV